MQKFLSDAGIPIFDVSANTTATAARNAAVTAAASGDELLNLTMAVNGKGVHAMETHREVYRLLKEAVDDGPEAVKNALRDINNTFKDTGTLLDPFEP